MLSGVRELEALAAGQQPIPPSPGQRPFSPNTAWFPFSKPHSYESECEGRAFKKNRPKSMVP
jgi:hypothetical protein